MISLEGKSLGKKEAETSANWLRLGQTNPLVVVYAFLEFANRCERRAFHKLNAVQAVSFVVVALTGIRDLLSVGSHQEPTPFAV